MDVVQVKNIIGVSAVILVFIGYVPYIRDLLKGKTIPHVYSWFLWGFVTAIAFALQMSDNAGIGALVTLSAALICIVIIFLSLLLHRSKFDITKIDTFFLLLAFLSLGVWLIAKEPILATILATMTDLLGFAPTIRKSWNKPYTETLSFYIFNTIRFALAVIALQHYSIMTALYPISWCLANGLFGMMLVVRRKSLSK